MKFTLLADSSPQVPDLTGIKTYEMFKLTTAEWNLLQLIRECLKVSFRTSIVMQHLFLLDIGTCTCMPELLGRNSPLYPPRSSCTRIYAREMGDHGEDGNVYPRRRRTHKRT